MGSAICGAYLLQADLRTTFCPTCKKDTLKLCQYFEWYGPSVVCLECGERWEGGERLPRPFAPKWREKSVERARNRMAALDLNEKGEG
jgi:ribosomal protein L37AE/L43A